MPDRSEKKENSSYRSAFRYVEFVRNIALPKGVDREAVKASCKDGVLEVRIPWPEEPDDAPKKIPVNRT